MKKEELKKKDKEYSEYVNSIMDKPVDEFKKLCRIKLMKLYNYSAAEIALEIVK